MENFKKLVQSKDINIFNDNHLYSTISQDGYRLIDNKYDIFTIRFEDIFMEFENMHQKDCHALFTGSDEERFKNRKNLILKVDKYLKSKKNSCVSKMYKQIEGVTPQEYSVIKINCDYL